MHRLTLPVFDTSLERTDSIYRDASGSPVFGLLTVGLVAATGVFDLATSEGIAAWAFYTLAFVTVLFWKGRRAVTQGSEGALEARAQQQAAVATLGQQALGGQELSDLFDEAAAVVARTLVVEYSQVLELSTDGQALRLIAGVGWREGSVGQIVTGAAADSDVGYTLRSQEPVIVADLRRESRFRKSPLLHEHRVASGLSVVIQGTDRPFGVLSAYSCKSRSFTHDDVHFLQAAANVLAQAIQRKRAEAALRENEERLRAILDAALDAVIEMDDQGAITDWNRRAESIFGWKRKETLGRNLAETIIPQRYREAHQRGLQHFLSTGDGPVLNRRVELSALRRDGKEFPVELSVISLKRDGTHRFVAFITDITERKRAADGLRTSREQLRNLASRMASVKEEQAMRISREIHDELGQALTGLKMDLAWLSKRLAGADEMPPAAALQEKIRFMTVLADTMIRTVRRIASELRPDVLDDLGLVAAIEWQAQEFQVRTGTRCEFAVRPQAVKVDNARSTALFRIVQEILTNAARHAKATKVVISLREAAGQLVLEVSDNGKGITDREITDTKSLGLVGMRERALAVGGDVHIQGSPGNGTTVTVRIPTG